MYFYSNKSVHKLIPGQEKIKPSQIQDDEASISVFSFSITALYFRRVFSLPISINRYVLTSFLKRLFKSLKQKLKMLTKERCAFCEISGVKNPEILSVHHVLPQAGWNGGDKDGHLLLCDRCHLLLHVLLFGEVGKWVKSGDSWEKMREKIKICTARWLTNASSPE